MTTMNAPGSPSAPTDPVRTLRRSQTDRMLTGVAGGLGEYFAVDPVIFRVVFAVLSFFGGVGILLYLACWLLLPEPTVEISALDKLIAQLRIRHIPPWLVIGVAALIAWGAWFAWWMPGPTLPAVIVFVVVLALLVRRLGRQAPDAKADFMPADPAAPTDATQATEALVPPLNDQRRSMNAWYAEAREAQRTRRRRRRPVRIAVIVTLLSGLVVLGAIDAATGIPFGVYLWFVFAVLVAGLLAGLATRRTAWEYAVLAVPLIPALIVMGGTSASLKDGSGRQSFTPTSVGQLSDEHQFAGQTTLDLTRIGALPSDRAVRLEQGAGEVVVRVPRSLNVLIDASVHVGEIQVDQSRDSADYVSGFNTRLTVPPTGASGSQLTVRVHLTAGHIQIDRVG